MSRRTALVVLGVAAAIAAAAVSRETRAGAPDDRRAEARVELGRRLFFDPAIGRQGKVGCASCHDPEHGFSDPREKSVDENGELPRHSQPLTDLMGDGFHWDGEFDTVREVIDARVLPGALPTAASLARTRGRLERAAATGTVDSAAAKTAERLVAGFSSYYGELDRASGPTTIVGRLKSDGRYAPGFRAAFGSEEVTATRVGDALDAYLATLRTTTNAYDRFLAGDEAALSPAARRGLAIFRGKAGCAQCHVAEGPRAVLTDGKFHNTGVAARRAKKAYGTVADSGRAAMSFGSADRGAFKTPSLRDVARRAPYFHDASAKTLEEVVRYYAEGGTSNDHLDRRVRSFEATDAEVADLVEFLRSLTGSERAGLGSSSALRSARLTVRAERPDGSTVPGVQVVLRPCGDRLAGTKRMPAPITATTGPYGEVVVDMPLSTHFAVEAPGAEPGRSLPDWTSSTCVVVIPKDRVALIARFAPEAPAPSVIRVSADSGDPRRPLRMWFMAERKLDSGAVVFTAPASADRRGLVSCSIDADWTSSPRLDASIDFTPGATNHVELSSSSAASPERDVVNAISRDAEAIKALLEKLPKSR